MFGGVSEAEFMHHHAVALRNHNVLARATKIFRDYGPLASWKIDKLFENAIERSRLLRVVNALEELWEELLKDIPDIIERQLQIRLAIDVIYAEHFPLPKWAGSMVLLG